MIKFHCSQCDKKIGVPEEYSGKLIKCPQCKQPARVPELELELEPAGTQASDSVWPDDLLAQSDESCDSSPDDSSPEFDPVAQSSTPEIHGSGMPAETLPETSAEIPTVKIAAKLPLALAAGFAGASIGAVAWAAIVYYTQYEVGFVAWGIGVLAGLAVLFVAKEDASPTYGVIAAAMALVGLLGGKLLSANWIIEAEKGKVRSSKEMRESVAIVVHNEDAMFDIACQHLVKQGEFDAHFADMVIAVHDVEIEYVPALEITIPPDREEEVAAAVERVKVVVAGWSTAEKEKIATDYFEEEVRKGFDELTYFDRLKESISFWDALWFFLALGSAYKLGAGVASND